MLRAFDIQAAPIAKPLIVAAQIVSTRKGNVNQPAAFLRRNFKWHRHLQAQETGDHKLWEVSVLFHMRDE